VWCVKKRSVSKFDIDLLDMSGIIMVKVTNQISTYNIYVGSL
jgi:hypothetical protein